MHVCSTYDSLYACFIRKNRPASKMKSKSERKRCAAAGFVLSIFRSAFEDATPTPRGEKEFGEEFNKTHYALKL